MENSPPIGVTVSVSPLSSPEHTAYRSRFPHHHQKQDHDAVPNKKRTHDDVRRRMFVSLPSEEPPIHPSGATPIPSQPAAATRDRPPQQRQLLVRLQRHHDPTDGERDDDATAAVGSSSSSVRGTYRLRELVTSGAVDEGGATRRGNHTRPRGRSIFAQLPLDDDDATTKKEEPPPQQADERIAPQPSSPPSSPPPPAAVEEVSIIVPCEDRGTSPIEFPIEVVTASPPTLSSGAVPPAARISDPARLHHTIEGTRLHVKQSAMSEQQQQQQEEEEEGNSNRETMITVKATARLSIPVAAVPSRKDAGEKDPIDRERGDGLRDACHALQQLLDSAQQQLHQQQQVDEEEGKGDRESKRTTVRRGDAAIGQQVAALLSTARSEFFTELMKRSTTNNSNSRTGGGDPAVSGDDAAAVRVWCEERMFALLNVSCAASVAASSRQQHDDVPHSFSDLSSTQVPQSAEELFFVLQFDVAVQRDRPRSATSRKSHTAAGRSPLCPRWLRERLLQVFCDCRNISTDAAWHSTTSSARAPLQRVEEDHRRPFAGVTQKIAMLLRAHFRTLTASTASTARTSRSEPLVWGCPGQLTGHCQVALEEHTPPSPPPTLLPTQPSLPSSPAPFSSSVLDPFSHQCLETAAGTPPRGELPRQQQQQSQQQHRTLPTADVVNDDSHHHDDDDVSVTPQGSPEPMLAWKEAPSSGPPVPLPMTMMLGAEGGYRSPSRQLLWSADDLQLRVVLVFSCMFFRPLQAAMVRYRRQMTMPLSATPTTTPPPPSPPSAPSPAQQFLSALRFDVLDALQHVCTDPNDVELRFLVPIKEEGANQHDVDASAISTTAASNRRGTPHKQSSVADDSLRVELRVRPSITAAAAPPVDSSSFHSFVADVSTMLLSLESFGATVDVYLTSILNPSAGKRAVSEDRRAVQAAWGSVPLVSSKRTTINGIPLVLLKRRRPSVS